MQQQDQQNNTVLAQMSNLNINSTPLSVGGLNVSGITASTTGTSVNANSFNSSPFLMPGSGTGMGISSNGLNDLGMGNISSHGTTESKFVGSNGKTVEIREVWEDNLDEEMENIRDIIDKYPYVAMDTEFPGVIVRPTLDYNSPEYQYTSMKLNVDLLKIIQLGITFANEKGEFVEGCPTWQFNFKFNLNEDFYAPESIDLLKGSGIDFYQFKERGIDVERFGELLMTSGLVLMDNVKWISFHSSYDFGYLIKVLTCSQLPDDEASFFNLLRTFFPCFYDIKYMVANIDGMHGGLQRIAELINVNRIGPQHQAGSDSLLTAQTFFRLMETNFAGVESLDDTQKGHLFGLGGNHTVYRGGKSSSSSNTSGSVYTSGVSGRPLANGSTIDK